MPNDLDRAMALVLASPSSENVRRLMREIRLERADVSDIDAVRASEDLHSDCKGLHRAALALESDPETVERNTMARVLSGIAPVVDAFQEVRTFRQKDAIELFSDVVQILAEVGTASQYLAGAKLQTEAHFSESLVQLEERLSDIVEANGTDVREGLLAVSSFVDSVRKIDLPLEAKPFVPFILWALLVTADYKLYRMTMGGQ
jgi:hypothetical protein